MSFTPYLCGGEVQLPVSETSWSPAFGMCKDRFGIPWGINCGERDVV